MDKSGLMPKERVADAVRCHGQNPLNTEVLPGLENHPAYFSDALVVLHFNHVTHSLGRVLSKRSFEACKLFLYRSFFLFPSPLQIRDIVKRFKGPSITLAQFQEVAR